MALFTGLGQSSITDLDSTMSHFFPPEITTSPMPHLPPGPDQQPQFLYEPAEGRKSHNSHKGELNTHCALEVPKSPSAGELYVSSSKSFDLAKPHAIPKAHHSETLLAKSAKPKQVS